ncbi:MAG: helix-turn-helix transcriptional regulator [Parcubacteria group bacterium]|nr:helix-turn-helix transcriptional regulator [Parcubacteria group bacterium]
MEEKKSKTVGDKIKSWRKKKDLTQDALAKTANIPYTTIAKIESDVIKNPSLRTITKIAEGLGITIDELVKN